MIDFFCLVSYTVIDMMGVDDSELGMQVHVCRSSYHTCTHTCRVAMKPVNIATAVSVPSILSQVKVTWAASCP